ncbi:hypothetical protein StoSoilB13_08500 [Arthrobacter sp. StoSoilB13]|nr:hypothetical protein StoSoilB13_08500 [Arthrobacter sp. StoSoilB13]
MDTSNNNDIGRPTPEEANAAAEEAANRRLAAIQPPDPSSELTVAERQINILRDKLRHIDRQLAAATQNNSKLVSMLETAKGEILRLKGALEQEGQPPYSFGTVVQINPRRQPGPGIFRAGGNGGIRGHFQCRPQDACWHQPAGKCQPTRSWPGSPFE